jgi:hypothetical protein
MCFFQRRSSRSRAFTLNTTSQTMTRCVNERRSHPTSKPATSSPPKCQQTKQRRAKSCRWWAAIVALTIL